MFSGPFFFTHLPTYLLFLCAIQLPCDKWKSDDCAHRMMDIVGIDKFAVTDCMARSGGLEDDVVNTMLETQVGDVPSFNLIPSIYVNDVYVTGALSTSRVLSTICRG